MTTAIFDKSLELQASVTKSADFNGVGVNLPVRYFPTCDWVVLVTGSTLTSVPVFQFRLAVSDLIGGTYTTIATLDWPANKVSGKIHVPINAAIAALADADSDWMRVTCDLVSGTGDITYASYLAKAADKMGIGARVGDLVAGP